MLPEAKVTLGTRRTDQRRILRRINFGDTGYNALLWFFGGLVLLIAGVIVFALWGTALYWWAAALYIVQARRLLAADRASTPGAPAARIEHGDATRA